MSTATKPLALPRLALTAADRLAYPAAVGESGVVQGPGRLVKLEPSGSRTDLTLLDC